MRDPDWESSINQQPEEILAAHDFNEERTLAFTTTRRPHPKDQIGWLISGLLLFFFALFSVGRLTIIGQFLDDVFFNLGFGWFKFVIYFLLFSLDLAVYFGIRFKFKLRFLLMIFGTALLFCWFTSLVVMTYLFDQSVKINQVEIEALWSPNNFINYGKIYWFGWLNNSVFSSQYAIADKMDFLISATGYWLPYGGGGMIGVFLAGLSSYLSLPGAYFCWLLLAFFHSLWVLTGDPFYLCKPKTKRRGRNLRILSLKAKNNPNQAALKKTHQGPIILESTSHHNQAVKEAINDSDLTIKLPDYNFTNADTQDLKAWEKTLSTFEAANAKESSQPSVFPIFESSRNKIHQEVTAPPINQSSQMLESEKFTKANFGAQFPYQSRRLQASPAAEFTTFPSHLPRPTMALPKSILNSLPDQSHYGDVDPNEARLLFEQETKVTPFGAHENSERTFSTQELDFFRTLYAEDLTSTLPLPSTLPKPKALTESKRSNLLKILKALPLEPASPKLLFILGQKNSGECLTADLEKIANLLIINTDQQNYLHLFLNSLFYRLPATRIQFFIADQSSNSELKPYAQLPHLKTAICTSPLTIQTMLQDLVTQILSFQNHLTTKVDDSSLVSKLDLVLIFNHLETAWISENPQFLTDLKFIVTEGMKHQIHFILAIKPEDVVFWNPFIEAHFTTQIKLQAPLISAINERSESNCTQLLFNSTVPVKITVQVPFVTFNDFEIAFIVANAMIDESKI